MDYHYHARRTIVRREELAKSVLEGGQVGPAVSGPGCCRVERSEFAYASFAAEHVQGEDHGDRATEAAALDRRADRA
jgi:hypothetical protein